MVILQREAMNSNSTFFIIVGTKCLVQAKTYKNIEERFQNPTANTCFMSSKVENKNSYNPLPRENAF